MAIRDSRSGIVQTFKYASAQYCALLGVNSRRDRKKSNCLPAILYSRSAPEGDWNREDSPVEAVVASKDSRRTLRLLIDGEYRWQQASVHLAVATTKEVVATVINEDVGKLAAFRASQRINRSCQNILRSLIPSLFDFVVRLDDRLRIVGNDGELRKLFQASTLGRPLEAFVPLTSDKVALKQYFANSNQGGLLKLRMTIGPHRVHPVQVFAAPVQDGFLLGLSLLKRPPRSPPPSPTSTFDRRHLLALHWVQRSLYRDLETAIALISADPDEQWLIPAYHAHFEEVGLEEVTRMLPNNFQAEFVQSWSEASLVDCSQLLTHSIHGCANVLSIGCRFGENRAHNISIDSLLVIWRLFISMVARVPTADKQYSVMNLLDTVLTHKVSRLLDRDSLALIVLQFTLALVTSGLRFPSWFGTSISLLWLRRKLTKSLSRMRSTFPLYSEKHRSLPLVYYLCVLWACLMKKVGRADEAVAMLRSSLKDMHQYTHRHPYCLSVRQLEAIALYNLALELFHIDRKEAIDTVRRLAILARDIHPIALPGACSKLIEWCAHQHALSLIPADSANDPQPSPALKLLYS